MSLQLQREKLMHLREVAMGSREATPPRVPADPGPPPAAPREAALTLHAISPLGPGLFGLDRERVPSAERFEWQPPELVAVLGEHAWRHWGDVTHVAFSPDGRQVASVGEDGVRVWNRRAAAGSPPEAFHLPGACRFIAFSPDWQAVVTLEEGEKGEGTLHVWDLSRGLPTPIGEEKCDWTWTEPRDAAKESDIRATAVAVHPSSRFLAIGHANGTVHLRKVDPQGGWDLKLHAPGKEITALAFSPDELHLALGTADGQVQLWELAGPLPRPTSPFRAGEGRVAGLTFGADGVLAVACRTGPVRLLRLAGPAVSAESSFSVGSGADFVSFSPQGRLLAVWVGGEGTKVLDVSRPLPALRWEIDGRGQPPARPGLPVAFGPTGTTLAVGDRHGAVVLWDLSGDRPTAVNPAGGAPAGWLTFSPDGSLLVAAGRSTTRSKDAGRDGPIRVWALNEEGTFGKPAEIEGGGPLVFSSDGQTLAGCDEKRQIRLWKREGDTFRPSHPLAKGPATAGADSPVEVTIVDRRIVHISGLGEGSPFATPGPKVEGTILAASPGGNWVVTGQRTDVPAGDDPQRVALWSVNGRQAQSQTTAEVRGEVLAVSPDGTLLLTSSGGGKVMLGKVGAAEPVRLWWFPGRVLGAAFAYDGRHLALGNANGTIYVLRLPDEVLGKS
jgi:WD40 repeat protein